MLLLQITNNSIIGLTICITFNGLAITIISFGMMGLGCSSMFPILLAFSKNNFPKYTNTLFGILISAAGIGVIIHPLVMGSITDSSGLKAALTTCFVPLALLFLTQITLLYLTRSRPKLTGQTD